MYQKHNQFLLFLQITNEEKPKIGLEFETLLEIKIFSKVEPSVDVLDNLTDNCYEKTKTRKITLCLFAWFYTARLNLLYKNLNRKVKFQFSFWILENVIQFENQDVWELVMLVLSDTT